MKDNGKRASARDSASHRNTDTSVSANGLTTCTRANASTTPPSASTASTCQNTSTYTAKRFTPSIGTASRITHLGSLSRKNVSKNIDFKVSFIFIKSTEGASLLNPYYNADYAAARKRGYPVGTYHYFTHLTSGSRQAWHFLSHSHFRKGDLPPVLDLEPLPSQVKKMGVPDRCGAE